MNLINDKDAINDAIGKEVMLCYGNEDEGPEGKDDTFTVRKKEL